MVCAADPLGLWPLLLCEQTPDQVAGGQHPQASLCQEVVLISEEYGSSGPTTGGMSDFGAQKKEPGTGSDPSS